MAANISAQILERGLGLCPAGLVAIENDGLCTRPNKDRLDVFELNANHFEGPIRFTRYAAWEGQDAEILRACLAVAETAGKEILPGLYEKAHPRVSTGDPDPHLMFVIGNPSERQRETISNWSPHMNVEISNARLIDVKPGERDWSIFANEHDALTIIHDIYGAAALNGLVCLDFVDIQEAFSGCFGVPFMVESSEKDRVKVIEESAEKNGPVLGKCDSCLVVFSQDFRNSDIDLAEMDMMIGSVVKRLPEDAEIIWTVNNVENLEADFRALVVAGVHFGGVR